VLVLLGDQFGLIGVDVRGGDADGGAGRAIAEMAGEVQQAAVLGDLHVQREVALERCSQSTLKPRKSR
jgi:hypothetical protein